MQRAADTAVGLVHFDAGRGREDMDPKISANFPLRPPTVPSGSGSRGVREMLLDAEARRNTRRTSFPDWLPGLQGYAGKSKPASAETAEIVRLRSEAHAGVEADQRSARRCWQGE